MIYITGDMHGDQRRLTNYILNKNWTHDDILIVCGDFGYIFYNDYSEHLFLNDIEEKCPFTIAFLAGNHENFNAIKKYPQEEWCGNLIHRIRKNIVFLINGNIYNINNMSFFVFGGGTSRDKEFRELNATWFEEEMPVMKITSMQIKISTMQILM